MNAYVRSCAAVLGLASVISCSHRDGAMTTSASSATPTSSRRGGDTATDTTAPPLDAAPTARRTIAVNDAIEMGWSELCRRVTPDLPCDGADRGLFKPSLFSLCKAVVHDADPPRCALVQGNDWAMVLAIEDADPALRDAGNASGRCVLGALKGTVTFNPSHEMFRDLRAECDTPAGRAKLECFAAVRAERDVEAAVQLTRCLKRRK